VKKTARSILGRLRQAVKVVRVEFCANGVLRLNMIGSAEGILALLDPRWTIIAELTPIAVIGFTFAVQREFAASAPWTSLQLEE